MGGISRQAAENRLRPLECGAFLIRESESTPGEFSVSVRSDAPLQMKPACTGLYRTPQTSTVFIIKACYYYFLHLLQKWTVDMSVLAYSCVCVCKCVSLLPYLVLH